MKRDFKVISAIADVHIGNKAISWKEYKYQLKKGVIEKLEKMTFLDMIVICGDTLHCQVSMNNDYASVFFWFIGKLVKIAKKKKSVIRIIKGTRSHDLDQLDTIKFYEDDPEIDFKIIDDYMIESIDGCNYAYIAENYIDLPVKEYYEEIFNKPKKYFDIIFGHLTIEQTQFTEQNSENLNTQAPIFKLKDFYKVSNLTVCGHIHSPMNFNDRFFYVGSTLRTCHGEEHDKGWNVITYLPKEKLYRVDKIVNEYTFNFNTLEVSNRFIEKNDVDHIVEHVENYIEKNNVDRLSLKITCIDKEETTVKIELLKKYFAKNPNITTQFKVLSEKSYEQETKSKKDKEIKPYLKDGLDIVERIKLWSLIERNYRLEDEDILRFITPKTLKREGV